MGPNGLPSLASPPPGNDHVDMRDDASIAEPQLCNTEVMPMRAPEMLGIRRG